MEMRQGLKNIAKELFYYTGCSGVLLWLSRYIKSPMLLIMTYHRISAKGEYVYMGVPCDVFEDHIIYIKNKFKIISMTEGIRALYEGGAGEIYATINLDDGYMDNYINAFGVLKRHKVAAAIFLTTDFIGKEHSFWWDRVSNSMLLLGRDEQDVDYINRELAWKTAAQRQVIIEGLEKAVSLKKIPAPISMLGWSEIKEMVREGIYFGSHTKTHANLCLLDDDEAIEEIEGSKKIIEQNLGLEAEAFCYPHGILDKRITGLVRKAGYKYSRSTSKGFNHTDTDRYLLSSIGAGSLSKKSFLASRIAMNSIRQVWRNR